MGDNEIKITVKFCGRPIPITISPDSTVLRLKNLLLPLTNVLPRGQKLIFKGYIRYKINAHDSKLIFFVSWWLNFCVFMLKGKVLANEETLGVAGVTNGVKLMLIGTQGVHQGVSLSVSIFFFIWRIILTSWGNCGKKEAYSVSYFSNWIEMFFSVKKDLLI